MDDERFTEPYQDPGWRVIYQRPIESPGVLAIRMVFLSLVATPIVLFWVLTNILGEIGELSLPLTFLILFMGLGGIGAASMTTRRKLSLDSAKALGTSYRNRFFVGFILNEVPLTVVAFALCFVEDAMWPYLIDFPLYLVGMALIAPGPRNFVRVQQQILTSGSSLQLGRSLDSLTESR